MCWMDFSSRHVVLLATAKFVIKYGKPNEKLLNVTFFLIYNSAFKLEKQPTTSSFRYSMTLKQHYKNIL